MPFSCGGNGAEKTAVTFVEHMLDGNAKKCTELMCEDLVDMAGYETKKLFINAFDKKLDLMIDEYKDQYGKRWKYNVSVIDSYDYEPEDYHDIEDELVVVVLEIEHKGGGLFKDKDGTDEFTLIMTKFDEKWLVYDFSF